MRFSRWLLESVKDILLPAPPCAKWREQFEFLALLRELLGVSFITYNTGPNPSVFVWGAETVGYHGGGFPTLSIERDPLYQQPYQLLALMEGFGRILLDVRDTFSERHKPRLNRLGGESFPVMDGEVGLDSLYQAPQVAGLIFQVCHVHGQLLL